MKTDKRYWFVLIIPIAAIIAIAVFLIPGHKHHDWDDEEEEENRTEQREGRTAVERITDEDLTGDLNTPHPGWGGNSPAIRIEPEPGLVISADANAFNKPTTIKFRHVTEEEYLQANRLIGVMRPDVDPFFCFDIDAGLQPSEHMPGSYRVEIDLNEMGVPEEVHDYLTVLSISDVGEVTELNTRIHDGTLVFDSDRNSIKTVALKLWEMCFGKAYHITGAGAKFVGGTIIAGAVAFGTLYWMRNRPLKNYFNANADDLGIVYTYTDGDYGSFKIHYRLSDTELSAKDQKELKELIKESKEIIAKLRQKAHDESLALRIMASGTGNYYECPTYMKAIKVVSEDMLFMQYMAEDEKIQKMLKQSEHLDHPQSVKNIAKMMAYGNRYLRDKQQLKVPSSICDVFLGDQTLTGASSAVGCYVNHGYDPYLAVLYNGYYIHKPTHSIKSEKDNEMLVTLTHELFHHYQTGYVLNPELRNFRLLEATAAVLERDFVEYLVACNKMNRSEVNDKLFADTDQAQWMLASLDFPIYPTFINHDFFDEEFENLSKTAERHRKEFADSLVYNLKAIYREWPDIRENGIGLIPTSRDLETTQRLLKDTERLVQKYHNTHLYEQLAQETGLTVDYVCDILGFSWAGEFMNGSNAEAGYFLGYFIDHLRKYKPSVTLHQILHNSVGWSLADCLKKGFNMEGTNREGEVFYIQYELFCKSMVKDILAQQAKFANGDDYKRYFYDQSMTPMNVSPVQPVQKLQCWGHTGAYACRTVKFNAEGKYNMFIVPHININNTEKVKASLLVGDSLLAPNPYYLECDSNGMKSPYGVALIFTEKMKDGSMSADEYFDAVALYAPTTKPTVEIVSGGGAKVTQMEQPPYELKWRGYVTGMAYTVRNNKTERENTMLKTIGDIAESTIAIPDWQPGEEADITVYCRWYYQPYANHPNIIYYSPKSGDFMASGTAEPTGVIVDKEFDMTHVLYMPTEMPVEELEQLSPDDRKAAEEFFKMLESKGRLTVMRDGRFSLKIGAINGSASGTEEGTSGSAFIRISEINIKGRGEVYENRDMNEIEITAFDVSSWQSDPVVLNSETKSKWKLADDAGYDSEENQIDYHYQLLPVITSRKCPGLLLHATDSTLRDITSFRLYLPDCPRKGKVKSKNGDNPWEINDIDDTEELTFSGHKR